MTLSSNILSFKQPYAVDDTIIGAGSKSEITFTTQDEVKAETFTGDTLDNEGFKVSEEFQDRRNTKNLDIGG